MRSERDSWDITTSVGSTALFVATARALEAKKADALAVDTYAELFCHAVGGPSTEVLDGRAPYHQLSTADFGEHFVNFQGARTKFFDDYFARAVDADVRQVVILAAGLDSRAYRLDWPAATTIFELDRAQILEFKREVLRGHGAQPRADRREIAVDLREDWPEALCEGGFDPDRPSAWIVEGLLIYLRASARYQVYTGIDGLAAAGSYVGIEDCGPFQQDAFEARLQQERAAIDAGEGQRAFYQLVYNEHCEPAAEWFTNRGWAAVGTPLAEYLHEFGRPVPDPETEVGSMVARNTLVSAVRA